jgi:uncharacterized membrane protein YphA (DoxX/SURF4 family)
MTPKSTSAVVARIALGAGFVFFGLNGLLQFLPTPPVPPEAGAFLGALAATGYMFPLIKGTEIVAGLLLLTGRLVPFALVLLAPLLVNIVLFHGALAPSGVLPGLVLLALELAVAWAYRDAYRPLFASDARSSVRPAPRESAVVGT